MIRYDLLNDRWKSKTEPFDDPGLIGASGTMLKFHGVIALIVRIGDLSVRVYFGVVNDLPPRILLGTSYIDTYIRNICPIDQKIHLVHSEPVPIIGSVKTRLGESPKTHSHRTSQNSVATLTKPTTLPSFSEETSEPTVIRLAKRVTIPANHYKLVTVSCPHTGFISIRPHWRTQYKQHVMAANGIADVQMGKAFKIWVGNFSNRPVTMVKNMRVAFADPPTYHDHDSGLRGKHKGTCAST